MTRRNPAATVFGRWFDAAGLRAVDVAAALGVTRAAVYNLRSGKMRPGLELAVKIQRYTSSKVPVTVWGKEGARG